MTDDEYLRLDPYRSRGWRSPTPGERFRRAVAERDFAERQVERLRRQLDPLVHTTTDPADLTQRIRMARELLPSACRRYLDAIERVQELRPARQPLPRREPQPVVWLRQSAAQAPSMTFRSGQDWLDYCRRGAR